MKKFLLTLFIICFFVGYAYAQANRSNASLGDEDCSDITDWTDQDAGTGVSSQATFDGEETFRFHSGDSRAMRWKDFGSIDDLGTNFVVTLRVYCDLIGTLAENDYFALHVMKSNGQLGVKFVSDGLFVHDGVSYNEVGTNVVIQDTWQEWTFDVHNFAGDFTTADVDIYLDGNLIATDVDCSNAGAQTDGKIYLRTAQATNDNMLAYVDFLKVGDGFEVVEVGQFIMIR